MTDEDFQDIRGIQPFVMTEDQLWNYETKFRGDEGIDGVDWSGTVGYVAAPAISIALAPVLGGGAVAWRSSSQ
jgi:hypothetical protein